MSGYDALDELHERLRGTEDARRAGEITPEAIRAARGGAVDESGRTHATAAENAADGDSEPLAGDSRDTRERIEADLLALTKKWHDYDGDFMKIYSSVAYAQVKELLDRQAALTERETKLRELYKFEENHREHVRSIEEVNQQLNERIAELQAKVDEYNQTRVLLPVDADGVPIMVGDVVDSGLDSGKVLRLELWSEGWVVVFDVGCGNTSRYESTALRHVETPDSWERICADLRAMDADNLIALGNGNYVEDTRHDEIAARIERMAKS